MENKNKKPLDKKNEKLINKDQNRTTKSTQHESKSESEILETSGARMPDPSQHSDVTETDVRYAFRNTTDQSK